MRSALQLSHNTQPTPSRTPPYPPLFHFRPSIIPAPSRPELLFFSCKSIFFLWHPTFCSPESRIKSLLDRPCIKFTRFRYNRLVILLINKNGFPNRHQKIHNKSNKTLNTLLSAFFLQEINQKRNPLPEREMFIIRVCII